MSLRPADYVSVDSPVTWAFAPTSAALLPSQPHREREVSVTASSTREDSSWHTS
jgi:hypothetical protein